MLILKPTFKVLVVFRHALVLLVCTAKAGNDSGALLLRFARHLSHPGIYTEDSDCWVWGGAWESAVCCLPGRVLDHTWVARVRGVRTLKAVNSWFNRASDSMAVSAEKWIQTWRTVYVLYTIWFSIWDEDTEGFRTASPQEMPTGRANKLHYTNKFQNSYSLKLWATLVR